jgi:iron complex transport system substrate-binding protein
MIRTLLALLAVLLLAQPAQAGRTIIDSAGRTVELPDRVDTVFAAGPPAAILLYVLAPDRMLGWPRANRADERDYLAEPYASLPELGTLTGQGGEANLERVVTLAPDLIIDFGSVRDTYVDLADRVQAQTGIPYLLIDGRFENTAAALRLLGQALGVPERGEFLAADAEATFARIDAILAEVQEAQRPKAYLARGPEGLESGVVGSINTEILERAGGVNVLGTSATARGLVQVNVEALVAADPDIIVTWDRQFFASHKESPLWQRMRAVQEGRVHLSPVLPFGWIDRPPSLNRLIGLDWMAAVFFPDHYPGDLEERTRDFYRLWYHLELTDDQLVRLLE